MLPIGCPLAIYIKLALYTLKPMISGVTSKNGIIFSLFSTWFQTPGSLTILQLTFLCYISSSQTFYTIVSSSMGCLYAYTPNVPSNVYERHWFCSCKCNVLINPPSKTSSCQAVSIIWSECQQAPILRSVISVECRTERVFCLSEMNEPYVLRHQFMWLNVICILLLDWM